MRKGGRRFSTRIREFPSFQSDARSPAPSLALPEYECLLCVSVPGLKELLVWGWEEKKKKKDTGGDKS